MLHLNYKELLGQCTTDVKKVLQILLRVDNDLLTYFREKEKKKNRKKGGEERKGHNLSNKPDNGSYTPVGLK